LESPKKTESEEAYESIRYLVEAINGLACNREEKKTNTYQQFAEEGKSNS